ncbi:MAG TPA: M23 family metallopeptidase [Rhizomicrobium sp.]
MAQALIERAWTWLHATFPERQVYVRSDGRVQLFTFGPTLQATCAGLLMIFLAWVAFASVNVIFKDRIIAAKDHRFQQMRGAYENRVADLQLSYDELNNALVSAEDRFKSSADALEAKQQSVARLLDQKQIFNAALRNIGGAVAGYHPAADYRDAALSGSSTDDDAASDNLGFDSSAKSSSAGYEASLLPRRVSSGSGASELTIMPQPVEPQPRTARPTQTSFLDDAVSKLAEALFPPVPPEPRIGLADAPALQVLKQQTQRVTLLGKSETGLLTALDRTEAAHIGRLHDVLRRVGMDDRALDQQSDAGVGGPLAPLQSVHAERITDSAFTTAYAGAATRASQLNSLLAALDHVPLTTPVHGAEFEFTSGFGPRIDPFTGRVAFHTGVDFAGPWGSTVAATAPGVVVWAGPRGGYGNMIEIDHGFGFRTRYGHLSAVLVRVGSHVDTGSPIGKLGSTGRSTGPHVHYEVWSAGTAKDPTRFIEAGREVFN